MYLVLLDHRHMSPEDFQELIAKYDPDAKIVQSSSAETLLKISEKLSPEIIIIDFELVKDESTAYFETLREKSQEAYIIALVDHVNYDRILMVIEYGGIDGYLAKPIKNEELMARLHIAKRKKSLTVPIESEQSPPVEEQSPAEELPPADERETLSEGQIIENEAEIHFSPYLNDEPEMEPPSEKEILVDDGREHFGQLVPEVKTEEPIVEKFISEESIDDYIVDNLSSETAEEHFPAREDSVIPQEKEDSFGSLFDDISFDHELVPDDNEVRVAEEFDLDEPKMISQLNYASEEPGQLQREIDDAVVRPAKEFLTPGEKQDRAETKHTSLPENEMIPGVMFSQERQSPVERDVTDLPDQGIDMADIEKSFDFKDAHAPDVVLQSSLPGKSADEYLYGEEISADSLSMTGEKEFTNTGDELLGSRSRSKKRKARGGGFLRFISIIGNLVFITVLLLMAMLSFFLIQDRVSESVPEVAGYQLYVIMNDHMSPEFDTGSLVYGKAVEPEQILVRDIIAFRDSTDPGSIIASRVVEVDRGDGIILTTRGEAKTFNDPRPVIADNVIGRITGSVPYLGYLVDYVQTREGLILLIFVPGIAIIVFQTAKIIMHISTKKKSKNKAKTRAKKKKDSNTLN